VVELLTRDPKTEGSNHATGNIGREKMTKNFYNIEPGK
jgi:hypothetical protein